MSVCSDENGVAEASSPVNENCGFMAYNILAGGFLTDKYVSAPVPYDSPSLASSLPQRSAPRGRHDMDGWGRTLYRYRSDPAKEAVELYRAVAKEAGISLLELAVRWARERGLVTTSLLGVSSMQQLSEGACVHTHIHMNIHMYFSHLLHPCIGMRCFRYVILHERRIE